MKRFLLTKIAAQDILDIYNYVAAINQERPPSFGSNYFHPYSGWDKTLA